MQQPAPFQGGINIPLSQQDGERNAVWERKRQAYLAQQRAPASPLGKGAAGLPVEHTNGQSAHPNPAALPPSSNPLAGSGGPIPQAPYQNQQPQANNPAHFQQEWENSVADQTKRYQQQNDPSFTKTKKPTGYSVSKPPGGHSSIDLGWHEPCGQAEPQRQRQGSSNPISHQLPPSMPAGASRLQHQQHQQQQQHQQPEPRELPPTHGGSYQNRTPFAQHDNVQRAVGGGNNARQASVDRTQSSPYAWDQSQDQAPPRGGASGSYGSAPQHHQQHQQPPPPQQRQQQDRQPPPFAIGGQQEQRQQPQGFAYGGRLNASSSNRFANGDNQNSGNVISERSSTRVAAPPGGHSNFSFY